MLHKIRSAVLPRLHRFGVLATLYVVLLKALDSALGLKILRGVYVERPDPAFLDCPAGYTAGFLGAAQLRAYARDPATELSAAFLEQAFARGDACYALCEGSTLAAYGWYASGSTPIGLDDLTLHFSADYVYMYKGFTDARHRGRRLHAIGMTRALAHYLGAGYNGLVSYVEATNLDSLRSCLRMGYQVFGSIYVLRLFGRSFTFTSPGCRRFAFCLRRAPQPKLRDAGRLSS